MLFSTQMEIKDEGGMIIVIESNNHFSKFEVKRRRVVRSLVIISIFVLILLISIIKQLTNKYGHYSSKSRLDGHIAGQ